MFSQVVGDVSEETSEKLESSIDLFVDSTVYLLENEGKKVLPDGIVFVSLHSTLNLYCQVSNLVNDGL
jgi:hypothetical protein